MVTDSLRYWAEDLGVDGFRFDLASVLGRPGGGPFDPGSPLLTAIEADPVLRERKLIAEPWDATGDGYAVGRFRAGFAEWNDHYRDTVRDFWRGTPGVRDLGYRLSGSEDLYGNGRRPWASVNFVTAHDGFTLRDLVSYERKHNEANGQDNGDGTDNNRSANYGVEGDPADPTIVGDPHSAGAQPRRHPAAVHRHPDDHHGRRDVAHPTGQQQRLLPGLTDHLGRLVRPGRPGPELPRRDGRVLPARPWGPLRGARPAPGRVLLRTGRGLAATPSPIWCGSRPAASR